MLWISLSWLTANDNHLLHQCSLKHSCDAQNKKQKYTTKLSKTFHVHVMVISLTFHLLSSYFQEQFKIVRSFSFYKRTTCFEYLPCKIEKRHQGLLSFQSKVLQYKYKKKYVKICFNLISVLLVFFARKE